MTLYGQRLLYHSITYNRHKLKATGGGVEVNILDFVICFCPHRKKVSHL